MANSPKLDYTEFVQGGGSPEVPLNNNFNKTEAVLARAVIHERAFTGPVLPNEGDVFLIPTGADVDFWPNSGSLSSVDGYLAQFINGTYEYIAPYEGLEVKNLETDKLRVYESGAWVDNHGSMELYEQTDQAVDIASFNGTTTSIDISGAVSIVKNELAITMAATIKPTGVLNANNAVIMGASTNGGGDHRMSLILFSDGHFGFKGHTTDSEASIIFKDESTYLPGVPDEVRVVAVVDASLGSLTLYLDGVKVKEDIDAFDGLAFDNTNSSEYKIGELLSAEYFNGEIRDAQLWDVLWDQDNATYDFDNMDNSNTIVDDAAETTIVIGDLKGHWKLDDGTGSTAVDSAAVPHNGTITSGTWVDWELRTARVWANKQGLFSGSSRSQIPITATSLQNNYAAVVAPGVTDDSAAGYSIGSAWVDTVGDTHYIAVDVTNGAAVWDSGGGSGDVTAAANLGDNLLIRGDGAVKGVQNSGISIDDSDEMSGATIDSANNTLTLARVSGSTYSTVQHLQDLFHSSGVGDGGGITDDADGTITVAAGTGFIRASNSATAEIKYFDWASEAGANVALTDNDMNYVYAEYNSGSPQVIATITKRTDEHTNVYLGTVYRIGTDLHITEATRAAVGDHALKMLVRMRETMPFQRVTGGVIGETGTRNIDITAGDWWEGLTNFTTAAQDTSVADTFTYAYDDGAGGWTRVTSSTDINNTQYDDGSGSLATLSNNLYGVHWVYLSQDDNIQVLYGTTNGTLTVAQDADAPASVPPEFAENHVRLVGKIIIKKSDSSFTSIQTAFNGGFGFGVAADHGGLTGLSDDDHAQYPYISSQAGVPSSTPSRVGLVNVDTTNDNVYMSTDTASSADWDLVTNAGGVSDHGGLTGLSDDDHTQYALSTNQANTPSTTPTREGDTNAATTTDIGYIAVGTASSADWKQATGAGNDTTAIHDNLPGEISAITAKGTPTTSDYLLIEDAADSDNKKYITIGDLPGGGGGSVIYTGSNLTSNIDHSGSGRLLASTNSATKPGTPALSLTAAGTLTSLTMIGNATAIEVAVEIDGTEVVSVIGNTSAGIKMSIIGGIYNQGASLNDYTFAVDKLDYDSTLKIFIWQNGTTNASACWYTQMDR